MVLPIFPPHLASIVSDVQQVPNKYRVWTAWSGSLPDKDHTVWSALLPLTLVHGGLGDHMPCLSMGTVTIVAFQALVSIIPATD